MLTRGREWLRSTPRSSSSWATGLDVIEVPRSAWTAVGMPWMPIASSSIVVAMPESSAFGCRPRGE